MWVALFGLVIIVAAIVGGLFAGGIYTLVLIPLAVILAIPTFLSLLRRREAEGPGDTRAERNRQEAPLPRARTPVAPDVPAATPEDILGARREAM
jgi:hypothetical protein